MRSSNKRSRNKNNRRSVGNIVNRVFDSSGPEGKVRGTPQQIIEKYQTLARDAQLANDRVAVENFQQHAEHYTRMLAEAMREQEARREQQEQQQQNQGRGRDRQQGQQGNDQGDTDQPSEGPGRSEPQPASKPDESAASQYGDASSSADVIDLSENDDNSGLVETPESKPARKPRRSRRKKADDGDAPQASEQATETPAQ
jgi:hypothetical protein